MVTYGFFRPLDPKLNWKKYPVQIDFLPKITYEQYQGKTTIAIAEEIQKMMQLRSDKMVELDKTLPRK
jgi:hypothetical protein